MNQSSQIYAAAITHLASNHDNPPIELRAGGQPIFCRLTPNRQLLVSPSSSQLDTSHPASNSNDLDRALYINWIGHDLKAPSAYSVLCAIKSWSRPHQPAFNQLYDRILSTRACRQYQIGSNTFWVGIESLGAVEFLSPNHVSHRVFGPLDMARIYRYYFKPENRISTNEAIHLLIELLWPNFPPPKRHPTGWRRFFSWALLQRS